ncbi:MAG TPA: isoamylase [Mucilaginibacter sp.]|jgi:glycogen operon protein
MDSWYATEGAPSPMGVTYIQVEDAYNFAVYSKNAGSVSLLLYSDASFTVPVLTKILDFTINKSQRIWHCRIPASQLNEAIYYAYQITGNPNIQDEPAYWQRFDPEKVLLDPYAREVFFPPGFDPAAACQPGSNAGKAPLGYIHADTELFDWENDAITKHDSDLVIYEIHVCGFTKGANSNVEPMVQGTYAGITAKIPYLKALGITAVELMPVHQFDPSGNNYWGYNTLNFFSPHQQYASDKSPGGQLKEFKTMVRELHKADIEVLMDVVFNHTTEGDINGPVYSFKGIDNSTYYLLNNKASNPYDNYSGTGNTMRTDHPVVQKLIVDSLLYWIREMHIDGFRFDLASIFSRTSESSQAPPPIFAQLNDNDFKQVRLIAEPWDAGGAYQLGRGFPGNSWSQWNGQFRDDIRSFAKGDPGLVGTAITRIYGSDDIFPGDLMNAYHPYQSINFINCHDGFTLYDLVAYNNKHNDANGQNNTDGSNDNHSWNCGWEGDTNVPRDIMNLRLKQTKSLLTLLMLSNGTPMFVAGDEFLHTQLGNNNPYNQNNVTSWLDWTRLNTMKDHYDFTVQLIRFRKTFTLISRSRFWRTDFFTYGFDGNAINYGNPSLNYFAYHLIDNGGGGQELYVMINANWVSQNFTIAAAGPWKQLINTYLGAGQDITLDNPAVIGSLNYLVGDRSVVVLGK